jgi:predicted metalloenzyme YecM
MVVMPGRITFVELKAPGKKPTPKQLWEHQRLGNLGHDVHVLDSYESVDSFIQAMLT